MDNTKKIEELTKQRNELFDKAYEIGDKITRLRLEGYDYTGKYIYMPEYGYMFVTWQKLDLSHKIYSDDRMFFQGYAFEGDVTDYRDDYYLRFDAMQEWYISLNQFEKYTGIVEDKIYPSRKIKVLTKEDFIEAHNKMIAKYIDDWESMLKHCENNWVSNEKNDE